MARIFITGDTHRDQDWEKLNSKNFPEQGGLTKDDFVIILGDFGGVWHGDIRLPDDDDAYILDQYEKRSFTTLFVDGNHENHPAIAAYPEEEWCGGRVHRVRDSILHLMRGQIYEIAGKTFFTMGGATSTDKDYRVEGVTWWPGEVPSKEEMDAAIENLENHDFAVDYILTHECGYDLLVNEGLPAWHTNREDPVQQFMWSLDNVLPLQFKHWYFGHHHIDKQIDNQHTAVFSRRIEIT